MKTSRTNQNFISTVDENTTSFEIAEENQAFIIEALSKNIYTDPIGTIVREYSSNAWDANVEAKVNEPVVVELNKDASGSFFSVTDFGNGLDEEKIKSVFVKYGKSTKGEGNSEIGGFGIGAKSAFSYTDTFFVNTVANGNMYRYMVSKTNENPSMILLAKDETGKYRNGTEIRVYLKSTWDWSTFDSKIRRQLLHFQNVIYKIEGEINDTFTDKKIFDNKLFEINSKSSDHFDRVYALVGPVSYPINFSQLSIDRFNVPIGVKFDIGELDVTLSREELRYTDETIKALEQKIKAVESAVLEHNAKRSWWCRTAEEFYKKADDANFLFFGDVKTPAPESIKKANKKFRYRVMGVHPEFAFPTKQLQFLQWHVSWDGRDTKKLHSNTDYKTIFERTDDSEVYLFDDKVVSKIKMKYIQSLNGGKTILLIKKRKTDFNDYKMSNGLLRWKYFPIANNNFTNRIMSFKKKVERPILSKLKKLSDIKVPKSFIEANRTISTNSVMEGIAFNDIERPFGSSWRKTRIEEKTVSLDRNTEYKLDDIVIIYSKSLSNQVTDKMKMIKDNSFYRVWKKSETDYYGNKSHKFKKILLVQGSSQKQVQVLEALDCAISIEDALKLVKPTEEMKKVRKLLYWESNFKTDFSEFILKFDGYDKIGKRPNVSYSEKNRGYKHLNNWRTLFEENWDSNDIIPTDWVYQSKKIERKRKTFKEYKITRVDMFDFKSYKKAESRMAVEQELLAELLRKRSIIPSLNSLEPIFDFEVELIKEAKSKKQYLQSLVK